MLLSVPFLSSSASQVPRHRRVAGQSPDRPGGPPRPPVPRARPRRPPQPGPAAERGAVGQSAAVLEGRHLHPHRGRQVPPADATAGGQVGLEIRCRLLSMQRRGCLAGLDNMLLPGSVDRTECGVVQVQLRDDGSMLGVRIVVKRLCPRSLRTLTGEF